ncbi:putative ATP-dependent RNA helicase Dbp45A [Pseudolycoriella hygida]|uniref:RNA helicase n=1 Tax=Pseudolycoriella hygida TaxID=35572 RepID=A0A9Q0S235_9DIPT|nr:putative ATP-dependent RNA helicase Dbp45A [Pseudolycoriella hygida]
MSSSSSFDELGLTKWVVRQTGKLGLKTPTPIQANCIPEILSGKDVIGAAKTGSGKTFAFALPILQKLSEDPVGYFALILTPTHELAYQISEQFSVAGQPMNVRVCVVAGGTDQMIESQKLQNRPHIVVAMPGRLADHLTGCDTFSFDNLKFLVVDEADRMLNGSFDESLEIIDRCLPKQRQNLFFSATMKDFLKESSIFPIADEAFEWSEQSAIATVSTLDQRYILCAEYDRDQVLIEALRKYREDHETANVMIFTNTKKCCQLLSMTLNSVGLENVCLHGFMRQKERVAALNKFKSNHVRTIIATDVASRGLDIPSVQLVINHRLPKMPTEYIHRVGRTARAGRKGLAISIFRFPKDLEFLSAIEEAINTKLTEHKVDRGFTVFWRVKRRYYSPFIAERLVERIFMQVSVSKREAEITLDNKDFDERTHNYRRKKWIEDGLDPDEMEANRKKQQKANEKKRNQNFKKRIAERKVNSDTMAVEDERFKSVDSERFLSKPAKRKAGQREETGLMKNKLNSKKLKVDKSSREIKRRR